MKRTDQKTLSGSSFWSLRKSIWEACWSFCEKNLEAGHHEMTKRRRGPSSRWLERAAPSSLAKLDNKRETMTLVTVVVVVVVVVIVALVELYGHYRCCCCSLQASSGLARSQKSSDNNKRERTLMIISLNSRAYRLDTHANLGQPG